MRFEVLGVLRILDGAREIHVARPAQRRVLALLLLSHGRVTTATQLAEQLWGSNPPEDPRGALHVHVSGLRKALGGSWIETLTSGYGLKTEDVSVDAVEFAGRFTKAATSYREGRWEASLVAIEKGLALWRGVPYPDLAENDSARGEIILLEEQHAQLLEMRAAAQLALGRNEETIPALRALIVEYPLRERLWESLMLALYRVGRQAEALRVFQQARQLLGEELGIEPSPPLRELEERILQQDPDLGASASHRVPHNLPETTTSFVGREDELLAIADMLVVHRVVTLTGGPGVGKTRVAIEVGRRLLDGNPAGTWFVSVVPGSTARQVITSMSAVLGITESVAGIPRLAEIIVDWPGLLILDGADYAPAVADDLAASVVRLAGPLRLLITTRAQLGSAGRSYRLSAFPPVPSDQTNEAALGHPAIQLFIDRARALDRSFLVTDENIEAVLDLSRRLGGVPLAIELGADWARSLDAPALVALMDAGRGVGGRLDHTPLDAAVELSYNLLQPDAQQVFRVLSLFSGSFSLDDVAFVCGLNDDPFKAASIVARLTGVSLLEADRRPHGPIGYRLLEPLRAFGEKHVEGDEGLEVFVRRHADRYVALCAAEARRVGTKDERGAFEQLDRYLPNLRVAWSRLLARGENEAVVESVAAIDRFFFVRFLAWEGRSWLDRALLGVTDRRVRACGFLASGFLAYIDDEHSRALELLEESASLARNCGDTVTEGWALVQWSRVATWMGRAIESREASSRALELFEGLGNRRGAAVARLWFGINELNWSQDIGRLGAIETAVAELEELGDLRLVSVGNRMLAEAALFAGDRETARGRSKAAREAAERSADVFALVGSLVQGSLVESEWGQVEDAARLLLLADDHLLGSSEMDLNAVLGWPAVPALLQVGRWELAIEVLANSDAVMGRLASAQAPSRRAMIDRWRASAVERGGLETGPHDRHGTVRGTKDLSQEVRSVLAGITRSSE